MSRLVKLLKEEASQDLATINGKQYKFHSEVGNLFRLMLATNGEQPIPQAGSQSLVSKMLPDMLQSDPKNVKKLQTLFNKIKKTAKAGKKPTVAVKKEYYGVLFGLLLPLTAQGNFKPTTLVNNFSSAGKNATAFQRRATILIGKSLLVNKDLEITAKDRMLIKGYVMGMEALEDATSTDTAEDTTVQAPAEVAEEQPQNAVDSVVNSEKTTEEVQSTVDSTEKVLSEVRAMTPDNSDVVNLLQTNESPDVFKVNLTDNDAAAAPMINDKIAETFADVKIEFGNQTANFVGKFVSDIFKELNQLNGYLNFLQDHIDISVEKVDNGFKVKTSVGDETTPDMHKFFVEQTFTDDAAGNSNVYIDKVQIPESAQGSGINKKMFASNLELYKAQGVDKVSLEANVDVGGYAWFRYGFVPKDTNEVAGIAEWMKSVAPVINDALQYDAADVAQFVLDKTYTKTAGVENLVKLLQAGKSETSYKVLTTLLAKCGDELKETFSDKSKFKELGKNIALMNFKEYKIGGTSYSISYKALLSIQSLNVGGDKPVPLMSAHGNIYLNWMGELDMKDLDDTYAYLNL